MVEIVKEDSGDYLKPSGHNITMEGKMVLSGELNKVQTSKRFVNIGKRV